MILFFDKNDPLVDLAENRITRTLEAGKNIRCSNPRCLTFIPRACFVTFRYNCCGFGRFILKKMQKMQMRVEKSESST